MSMELLQSVVLGLQGATVDHVLVVGGDIKLPGFPSVWLYGWLRSVQSLLHVLVPDAAVLEGDGTKRVILHDGLGNNVDRRLLHLHGIVLIRS